MELVHDLKVPIQMIYSCAQLLQLELKQDSRATEYVQMMMTSAQQLRGMVMGMLDRDRRAAGPESAAGIDIVPELRGVCRRFEIQSAPSEKRIAFSSNVSALRMRTDPVLLTRIAQNLLSNALRYTPRGGCVDVRLESMGDSVEISVSDHGRGIPRDMLEHIFEVGVSDGGTGYGLAIVRDGAASLGGGVRVESDRTGSRFTVRLPVR